MCPIVIACLINTDVAHPAIGGLYAYQPLPGRSGKEWSKVFDKKRLLSFLPE
ncbi:hypothetical protein C3B79_3437 [Aeromonas hydrophila]|nr:hypothetical protein C3B79_3437 [Aeromonas hydrophila]